MNDDMRMQLRQEFRDLQGEVRERERQVEALRNTRLTAEDRCETAKRRHAALRSLLLEYGIPFKDIQEIVNAQYDNRDVSIEAQEVTP